MEQLKSRVKHTLTYRLEQNLAARENDTSDLLTWTAGLGVTVVEIEISHTLGEVLDNARVIGHTLFHHTRQIGSVVRTEPILIAVMTGAMAKKCCDVIDRFHSLLVGLIRPWCVRRLLVK